MLLKKKGLIRGSTTGSPGYVLPFLWIENGRLYTAGRLTINSRLWTPPVTPPYSYIEGGILNAGGRLTNNSHLWSA